MPTTRVRQYLQAEGVAFAEQEHERRVPAQRVAQSEHVSGWLVAKPVLLWADGEMLMVVVPAATRVDLDKVRRALGAERVRLAEEEEFVDRFPDCEPGAEPPFGHLYDVRTLVDASFPQDRDVVFRAGTHTTTMSVALPDYLRVTRAQVVDVAVPET